MSELTVDLGHFPENCNKELGANMPEFTKDEWALIKGSSELSVPISRPCLAPVILPPYDLARQGIVRVKHADGLASDGIIMGQSGLLGNGSRRRMPKVVDIGRLGGRSWWPRRTAR